MTVTPFPSRTVARHRRPAPRPRRIGGRRLDPVCLLDVLDVDDLDDDTGAARRRCLAAQVEVPAGRWEPPVGQDRTRGWLGLVIVAGLITRTVDVDGLRAKELLGPGDLLRPWDGFGDPDALGTPVWQALEDSRIAVLDGRFAACTAQWPALSAALLRTTVRRSHGASVLLSVSRARRADDRLLLLFRHLADRWGRVRVDGVRVPLRLTHAVIAELVCLRRPTVSTTLGRLREEGRLELLADDTWLLPAAASSTLAPAA